MSLPPPDTTTQTKLANTQQKGQWAASAGDTWETATSRWQWLLVPQGQSTTLPTWARFGFSQQTPGPHTEHSLDRWFLMKKSFSRSLKVFSFT